MAEPSTQRGPRFVLVTDTRATGPAATGRYAWRLDAANNRPLGRGLGIHASLAECRQWLDDLRRDAAVQRDLVDSVSFDSARGLWTWRLRRDGHVCVISVRTYLRRFECRRAAAHFSVALAATSAADGIVRIVRPEVFERYAAAEAGPGAAVAS